MVTERRTVRRRVGLYTALMVVAVMLWPALAAADPPVLKSVTVETNQSHPTSTWALPAGGSSQFIQTSLSSDTNDDGYFLHVENFNVVGPSDTSFADPFNFAPGVYYLHVAGHDKKCVSASICPPATRRAAG